MAGGLGQPAPPRRDVLARELDPRLLLVPASTNASGVATVTLPVPADPALRGGIAHAQAFVLDPLGAFGGVTFTAALTLLLGD